MQIMDIILWEYKIYYVKKPKRIYRDPKVYIGINSEKVLSEIFTLKTVEKKINMLKY